MPDRVSNRLITVGSFAAARQFVATDHGPSRRGCRSLFAAALAALFEPVEQTPGVVARQGLQPVRLALFDAVSRDRALGAKKLGLTLHLAVPHVGVVFSDVHENAHLRDRLKLRGA